MAKRAHPGKKRQPQRQPQPQQPPPPEPRREEENGKGKGKGKGVGLGGVWLEISWAKWRVFRFVFFGLMSVDAFLQVSHASRYGAGGFNVPHLSWLPLPEPGRPSITFAYGALSVLFALIAQGALVRATLPIATVLYGWTYFSSQLDSYQHHYLMWLLLLILCFVPRQPDPLPAGAAADAPRRVTTWALRLALIQVSIVYLWAAIAKIDTLWLDGTALFIQVQDGWVRRLIEDVGFSPAAIAVMVAELFLAVAVWNRRLWLPAIVAGVGLHVGIELVGLEIGLFSYLMIAIYLLLVPDVVYVRVAEWLAPLAAPLRRPGLRHAAWPAGIAGLIALFVVVPLPLGAVVVFTALLWIGGAVAGIVSAERDRGPRLAWAFAIAAAVPIAVHAETQVADDYYRFWGGAARRLGDDKSARRAYDGLLGVDDTSEYAHYHLGQLDLAAGELDAAYAHFLRAKKSAPKRARAYFGEANVWLRRNDPDKARTALEDGLRLEEDAQARSLLQSLKVAPAPGAGTQVENPAP